MRFEEYSVNRVENRRFAEFVGLRQDADAVADAFDREDMTETQQRQLGAHYLTRAKRGDGQPLDPVARFHLGNGALVHALNAGADTSPKGLKQSHGLMVNYLYDLARVSQNHERFASAQEVAMSGEVRGLTSAAESALKETTE